MADSHEKQTEATPKTKLVEIEERVLAFWNKEKIFEKSLARKGKEFVFYDGPPFATGSPHFGHLLPSTIKDIVPRYKTMRGFHVTRRWGWDCHGLPVENLIEKELGLRSKKDIVDYGIGKFNAAAKAAVLRYADEWRKVIPRIGRWVDMENDYRTMDASYTESVWWVFKTLYDKGLVYEGFKTMQICPRCETSLSNFEVNQGYKDITDISVYVRLALKGEEKAYMLAWTTTPWTLPGNVALAIGADMDYARVAFDGATYILARDRVADVFAGKEHSITSVFTGKDLVGKSYVPLFGQYDTIATKNVANGWKVYAADFVTTEDGTGIVHIAPAFGDDDLKLGQKESLPFIQHVGMDGRFKPEVVEFAGHEVKPKDDHQKADVEVIKWLAHSGHLFDKKKVIHSYPHCWRCETPLLNYATSSWFVRVTQFKDKLVSANAKVSWVPEEIGAGRFGKWLDGARDWAISRSRFWGAPIPIWRGVDSGKLYPVGNISDLAKLIKRSGNSYTLLRHGDSEANARGISNSDITKHYSLTANGIAEMEAKARELSKKGVDIIVSSDFTRTKESARILSAACGIAERDIVYDVRLREYNVGPEREGRLWSETDAHVRSQGFYPGMESPAHLKKRVFDALYDIDGRYSGKRIVILAHGSPLNTLIHGIDAMPAPDKILHDERRYFQKTAESHPLDFVRLPRNEDNDLDIHRPFIDRVECIAPDGESIVRVPEVFDCWFESGSMPYGESCYGGKASALFDPKGGLFKKPLGFPADFIAEGLDQTRGWFYSMLVLGVGLFGKSPYKNVVVNGLILAEDGQKMAKSKNNYPPLMLTVEKYGADSLRYFLASSPAVKAEDVRFSEKGVDEVSKKLLQRLDNVLSFYEMYAPKEGKEAKTAVQPSKNVLDQWILSRLYQTRDEITSALDRYQIDRAARPLLSFVDDLSTWYLRRSRDRFKSDDRAESGEALSTTRAVLCELSKVMAPFTPFYAEYLFGRVKGSSDAESVHLALWPGAVAPDPLVLLGMEETRRLVTLALQERSKANIKVRQPLSKVTIRSKTIGAEFVDLIKDEVNVKSVVIDSSQDAETLLDTAITDDLRKEGVVRDLIRAIQEARKTEGLSVGDAVLLLLHSDEKGKELVAAFLDDIKKVTLVTGVRYAHLPHAPELAIDEFKFRVGFQR